MATVKWSVFFDEVMPDLSGAPAQPLVENAIRNAVIDLCTRGLVWRVDLDPVDAIANLGEYDFDPDSGTIVVRALVLWYNKQRLLMKTPAELAEMYAHWPSETGTPLYFTQERPSESFILVPTPIAAFDDAVTGKLAIKPTRNATGCDAVLHETWRETVAHGAKAKLFAMKKKPWSDGGQAGYHQSKFDAEVAAAAQDASSGFTGKPKRVRAHFQ